MWIPAIEDLVTDDDLFEVIDLMCADDSADKRKEALSVIEANAGYVIESVMNDYAESPHIEAIREHVANLRREMAQSIIVKANED